MFYFDELNGKKILKSDYLNDIEHFFTTREEVEFSEDVISPEQTHSDNVGFVDYRTQYPDTDGLIITKPNQRIRLKFADCTPLIFYNPKKKIGAISHAGWRGTAQQIGIKTVEKMGGNPKDIITVIGPAIGLCCYEVSDEVREKLLQTINDTTGLYQGKNVDLKQINARQLQEIGIEKIDICPYCTSCNNDLFYSYRKENGTTKRHFAFLQLPEL